MVSNRQPIADPALLRKRVRRVLYSQDFAGAELRQIIDAVQEIGRTAIFGGMLRDLCFSPSSHFESDVDLVVDTNAKDALLRLLRELAGTQNRFGGYRLRFGRWRIDVWALRDTWALRTGLIVGERFSDLTRSTFFNWDAIVFEIDTEELYFCERYFEALGARLLELNLEPNPNPAGNVMRALRLLTDGATFGPRLTAYVARYLAEQTHESDASREKYRPFFEQPHVRDITLRLQQHVRYTPDREFGLPSEQLKLELQRRATPS